MAKYDVTYNCNHEGTVELLVCLISTENSLIFSLFAIYILSYKLHKYNNFLTLNKKSCTKCDFCRKKLDMCFYLCYYTITASRTVCENKKVVKRW